MQDQSSNSKSNTQLYKSRVYIHKEYPDIIVWRHLPEQNPTATKEMTEKLFQLSGGLKEYYFLIDLREAKIRAGTETRRYYSRQFERQLETGMKYAVLVIGGNLKYRVMARFMLRGKHYSVRNTMEEGLSKINVMR